MVLTSLAAAAGPISKERLGLSGRKVLRFWLIFQCSPAKDPHAPRIGPLSRALPEVLRLLSAYDGAAELQRGLDILLTGLTTILTRQAKPGRPRQHGIPPADPPLPVARP